MTQSVHPDGLSMLDKRKIEAEILKEVYETLKASHGEEVAKKTIAESVRRSAIEQAKAFAAAAPGGPSLKAFQDVMPLWTKGGALEIEVKEQTDDSFAFNEVPPGAEAAKAFACSIAERRTDSEMVFFATSSPWLAFRVS